jgi:ankyrin repeat protein
VQALLDSKADIKARNKDGDTPLHMAAANDQDEVVTLLLTYKAEVNARNNAGITPLQVAAQKDYKDVVDLLRKRSSR